MQFELILFYDFHQDLKNAIQPDTGLVSVMTVNNEIGVVQPVKDIGKLTVWVELIL